MDMLRRRSPAEDDEVASIAYKWPIQNSVILVYTFIYVPFPSHYTQMIVLFSRYAKRHSVLAFTCQVQVSQITVIVENKIFLLLRDVGT